MEQRILNRHLDDQSSDQKKEDQSKSWLSVGRSFPVHLLGSMDQTIESQLQIETLSQTPKKRDPESSTQHEGPLYIPRNLRSVRFRDPLDKKDHNKNVHGKDEDLYSEKTNNIECHLDDLGESKRLLSEGRVKRVKVEGYQNERLTHEGTLVDQETFATLGRFEVEGIKSGERMSESVFGRHDRRKAHVEVELQSQRYFEVKKQKRQRRSTNGPKLDDVVLSPEGLAELNKRCRDTPSMPEPWIELARCETEISRRLPIPEKQSRQLAILNKSLQHCKGHHTLIYEIMRIQELRYPPEVVMDKWRMILEAAISGDIAVIEEPSEDEIELPLDQQTMLIQTVISPHPSLLHSALRFMQRSFSLFSVSKFCDLLRTFAPQLIQRGKSKRSRFYQNPEQMKTTGMSLAESSVWREIAFDFILTLLSCGKWNFVHAVFGLLGHADFLIFQNLCKPNGCQSNLDELKLELKEYWDSRAPSLGHPSANMMYQSLSRSNVSTPQIERLWESITNIVEEIISIPIPPPLSCSKESPFLVLSQWFMMEDRLEDGEVTKDQDNIELGSFSLNPYLEEKPPEFCDVEPVVSAAICSYFLNDATPDLTITSHHLLLNLNLFPFTLAYFPSSFRFSYPIMDEFLSSSDLIESSVRGLLRRNTLLGSSLIISPLPSSPYIPSSSSVPNSPKNESPNQPPLPLNDLFGFDVSATTKCELAQFIDTLSTLGQLSSSSSPPDPPARDQLTSSEHHLSDSLHQIENRWRERQHETCFPLLRQGCVLALQLLVWHPDDTLLVHSVVGSLAYLGQPKLARRILKSYESNSLVWLTYATFTYAYKPNHKMHHSVRELLTKFAVASNLATTEFVIGWIRLECLAVIQRSSQMFDFPSSSSSSVILPEVCHLLCCLSEKTFSPWKFFCEERTDHSDLWNSRLMPTMPRLKSALNYFNDDLGSTSLDSSDRCSLSAGPFLSTLLACALLTVVIDGPKAGWDKFSSGLPIKDADIWSNHSHRHSLQVAFDTLLLVIISSSPSPSSSSWSTEIVQSVCMTILDFLPSHSRAVQILSLFYQRRSSLLKLRSCLTPAPNKVTTSYLKAVLLSELSSGFPCFYRVENMFETYLSTPAPHTSNAAVWNLYISYLYLCISLHFSVGLSSEPDDLFLQSKLRSAVQRARVSCPWSRKLWIQSIAVLSRSAANEVQLNEDLKNLNGEDDDLDHSTEVFLSEVELLIEKGISIHLNPVGLVTV